MKTVFAKGLVKFGLVAVIAMVAAVVPTKAQSLQYPLTVNIPFDFTVLDKKMPAGKYSFSRAQVSEGDLVIQISSADGKSVSRLTRPVVARDPANDGMLVFHQYGDKYFLCEIWPAGGNTGRALPKSRAEREAERNAPDGKVAQVRLR
jgi:hypothetical protein